MSKRNFRVIDGRIVLNCTIGEDNIQVTTETCPFCGKQHHHGTGGTDWGEHVWVANGMRTLHHRVAHCVPRGVEITLADGTVVSNDRGYYLGIGDQVPR